MLLNQFLFLAAVLFCIGVYGVLARRNAVLVLASIELMLNAVNINLVAFSHRLADLEGQVFTVFIITMAAGEAAVGTQSAGVAVAAVGVSAGSVARRAAVDNSGHAG